jgi:hypothetical protein
MQSSGVFLNAADFSPSVSPSRSSIGPDVNSDNLYAQCKHTFLHFASDDDMIVKSAAIRSASADDPRFARASDFFLCRPEIFTEKGKDVCTIESASTNDMDELDSCLESGESTPKITAVPRHGINPLGNVNYSRGVDSWWNATFCDGAGAVPQVCEEQDSWLSTEDINADIKAEVTVVKPIKSKSKNRRKPAVVSGPYTTLMMRGLPCSFTQDQLMDLIDTRGFAGVYDFFYLPHCGNSTSNLGYAFINFVEPSYAEQFQSMLDGVQLNTRNSTKTCTISAADIQGMPKLRKHFRRTAVSRGSRGPLFFNCDKPGMVCNKADDAMPV